MPTAATGAKPRPGRKPRPKVLAASASALAGAVIVLVARAVGVEVNPDLAYGMAAAALLAFGGGYQTKEE